MAFNKRTWLGRQGTGLNKFSIGGATPVTIVNQPDSVTQVGDALSAGNLNDLEDRIESAFDDVDTELDTKADEQDVTNLNNAINQLDHRVENLEQSKGDYVVSAYKDGSTTPSGKGKWCVVEGVEGVSRVENMLFKTSASGSGGGIGYTNNNGLITLSGESTSTYTGFFDTMPILINHSYLIFFADVVNPNSLSFQVGSLNSTVKSYIGIPKVTTALIDLPASGMGMESYTSGTNFNGISFKFFIRDLNVYFGTSDLSFLGATNDAKLATIQKDYPHLLQPSEYGARIVDWTGNGVRAEGVNIWDEEWENVAWGPTGKTPATSVVGCKNLVPCAPSTTYYLTMSSSIAMFIRYYDIAGNYISDGVTTYGGGTFTTVAGAYYIGFYLNSGYGTTYHEGDIQICDNSLPTSVKQTYHPYMENTLSFPSISLKSAGSVREKKLLNVEVEIDGQKVQKSVKTNPLGFYTFTGNETWEDLGNCMSTSVLVGTIKPSASSSAPSNVMIETVPTEVQNDIYSGAVTNGICVATNGTIRVGTATYTNRATLLTGKTLRFELATPDPDTYSDPILDNTLLTEAYGRLSTVQTGTVVDGIADLGFITL